MPGYIHCMPRLRADQYNGGQFQISGQTVDAQLQPYGPKRVRLYDRIGGHLLRETWSDANGAYVMLWLAYRLQGYTVISCNNMQNGVLDYPDIADFITPEPMS